jgi:DNA-binding transcriptional LysR family regulator
LGAVLRHTGAGLPFHLLGALLFIVVDAKAGSRHLGLLLMLQLALGAGALLARKTTVLSLPFAIALPTEHPLAARAVVPLAALATEQHIMFARHLGPRFFDAIVGACREAGFALNVVHEVDNAQTACALVAAGLGVCFVPAGIEEGRSVAIQVRPIKPSLPHVDMHIALAYKPQSGNELAPLFVDVVRDVVRRHSQPKPMRVASV